MKFSASEKVLIRDLLEKVCDLLCKYDPSYLSESKLDLLWEHIRIGFVYLAMAKIAKLKERNAIPKCFLNDLVNDEILVEQFGSLDLPEPNFSNLTEKLIGQEPLDEIYDFSILYGFVLEHNICKTSKVEVFQNNYKRKRSGSYFTPPKLAFELVQDAVAHLLAGASSKEDEGFNLVDPACGTGIFLVASQVCLQKHTSFNQSKIANMIYGVDLDPAAVLASRFAVWFATGFSDPFSVVERIKNGNSLIGAGFGSSQKSKIELDQFCSKWFDNGTGNKFFHWKEEFPEVFEEDSSGGFDLIVGNPPWEVGKPNSREFFARYVPEYFEYGKQKALKVQKELFEKDEKIHQEWLRLNEQYKNFSNWIKKAPLQFFPDEKGFQYQGRGDANLYKCFLEQAYYLANRNGLIAMIVPAGIYCDMGSKELRELFLKQCRWLSAIGYENMDKTFDIHRSFKYCTILVQKSSSTDLIATSFLNLASNSNSRSHLKTEMPSGLVNQFSPKSKVLLEVENHSALHLLEKIYEGSQYLGDTKYDDSVLCFTREYDMTLDSNKFVGVEDLSSEEFISDQYGNWLSGNWQSLESDLVSSNEVLSSDHSRIVCLDQITNVFVPLYEGRMIGQFDYSKKNWMSGKGRSAVWQETNGNQKSIRPQYLVSLENYLSSKAVKGLKTGYLAVGSDTNQRTMIASCLSEVACGNAVPVIYFAKNSEKLDGKELVELQLALTAILNSFVFDFALRRRLAGNNLNYFILEEMPLPGSLSLETSLVQLIVKLSALLNFRSFRYASALESLGIDLNLRALDSEDICFFRAIIDTLVLELYRLSFTDLTLLLDGFNVVGGNEKLVRNFGFDNDRFSINKNFEKIVVDILRQADPRSLSIRSVISGMVNDADLPETSLANPKGFWRVDRQKDMFARHTTLTLLMTKLKETLGMEDFLKLVERWFNDQQSAQSVPLARSQKEHAQLLASILNR